MTPVEAIAKLRKGEEIWLTVSHKRFHIKPLKYEDTPKDPGHQVFAIRKGKPPIIGQVYKEYHGIDRTKLFEAFDVKTGRWLKDSIYVSDSAIIGIVIEEFERPA